MTNAELFQRFIDQTDEEIGTDSSTDGSIGLFHVLASAFDWCLQNGVDFYATLREVQEDFAGDMPRQ